LVNRWSASLLVALVVLGCGSQRGAPSASSATDAYLSALRARDARALERVVPPDFDAREAIAQKLEIYARVDVEALRATYVPHDITPNIVTVRISCDAPAFNDVIEVQRFGREWYVMLGTLRGFTPGPTAQIRPASH
jgi:hypothetical protein